MSNVSSNDRIEDVAPGDLVVVDRGAGERPCKVVHVDRGDAGGSDVSAFRITFEDENAETFQLEMAAGTRVTRALESKWESTQSPTPHTEHP
ncbi:hypothetical protein CRI77_17350 [Mycolicibacterium duvalii]|uniref:Uncharacterized protein n=1 Tax=Mycolicibacterium duvalii TaxID=39688 RepID=A0A7I7K7S2_9MYCO|nr:hypothetical protein [Mycolicibacterium duvalii]MCV7366149.1 hypothetical protein [Mycolicibacterium duvalii]PEG38806.1 hypothetical protein CRI77_17350 [Mycolicibacterium duvalii]BBX19599.1 hypothetical protein MDUV_44590 [Mycolicibacterium duvalii]